MCIYIDAFLLNFFLTQNVNASNYTLFFIYIFHAIHLNNIKKKKETESENYLE